MQAGDAETLSGEQRAVLEAALGGANVFFTGKAGTGKSTLLRAVVGALRAKYGAAEFRRRVAVTALTGVAATHVCGQTLHAALGLGAVRRHRDVRAALNKADVRKRVRAWHVLIIDECSMLSAELLDAIERALCDARGSTKQAGGLQIIMCGDFFQLPPVTKPPAAPASGRGAIAPEDAFHNAGYAFETPAWRRLAMEQAVLTHVYRQEDAEFVELLDAVRIGGRPGGIACAAVRRIAQLCAAPLAEREGIKPTQIFTRNKDVDDMNASELAKLPGERVCYSAHDQVTAFPDPGADPSVGVASELLLRRSDFFRDCMAAPRLALAVGAQVMLLKNLDVRGGLVNGSRGVVAHFVSPEVAACMPQAQQQQHGAAAAMREWRAAGGGDLPVVRFLNGREEVVVPARFSAEVFGVGECARVQVPLKLAWAITVHKSQGMTLDYVRVSLRGVFTTGQAYVALSRARSLAGLHVVDCEPGCARSDPLVRGFYKAITPGMLRDDEERQAWWDRVHATWRERMARRTVGDGACAFIAD